MLGPVRSGPIDRLYRAEYGRLLAGLIRVVRDVELAEDVLQEAFAAAVQQWGDDGEPLTPAAWIFSTARNKAIDRARKRVMEADHAAVLVDLEADRSEGPAPEDLTRAERGSWTSPASPSRGSPQVRAAPVARA